MFIKADLFNAKLGRRKVRNVE